MSDTLKTRPESPTADQTVEAANSAAYDTANAGLSTDAEESPAFGPPAQPGEVGTLGPYRVLKELGRGGMGAVYLAFDTRLNRRVALKVMLPKYAAIISSKSRFIREARAAAGITHDHIVTIHEADERDGVPYMTMQLLQGYPLDEYIKQKEHLDLAEVLRIGRETALGLAAAHDIGLVHRDIKPANLWVEAPTGRIKILDFGLAKPTQDDPQDTGLTVTGAILGTPAFMAPEQALGEKADHRADLFSLGVVLYRLTTGHSPFYGSTVMAMLTAVITEPPTPVRERNPAVPEPFAKLIQQLLEKDADDRPPSATAVATAIAEIERGATAAVPMPVQAIPLDGLPTVSRVSPGPDPFAEIDATEPGEVVHAPTPLLRGHPSDPAAAKRKWWPFVAVGLLAAALAVAIPQILKVSTPKGTLVIETTDPDVEVVVKKGTATIFDKTKQREIVLSVGDDYMIDLVEPKGGLKLSTKTFEITKDGKATVKVRVEKPAVAAVKPAAGAANFRVANGVTTPEFKAWAEKLPEGYRPTYVSARVGAVPPVYDAVALPVHGEYYLELPIDGKRVPVPKDVQDRMGVTNATAVTAGEQNLWTGIWVRSYAAGSYFWFGDAEFTANHDQEALRGPSGARPTSLAGLDGTHYTIYWSCALTAPGPPWEAKTNVALDQLSQAVDDARTRGWRPELLGVDTVRTPMRFRATFCQNSPQYDWDFSAKISAAEYQKQLDDRTAKGFHPRCVCSSLVNGKVEYVVLWLKEPAEFRLSAAARKALQAVLDVGAKLEVEMAGHRVEIPGGATLPDYPMAVLNIDGLGNKAITDAVVAGWKDLPPVRHWLRLGETAVTDKGLETLATYPGLATVQYLSIANGGLTDAAMASVGKFPAVKYLTLDGNPITSDGFRHLKNLKLESLSCENCDKVDGVALEHLRDVTTFRQLWLYKTNLSDAGVNQLAGLTNLETLFMTGAKITDGCVDTLLKLQKLQRLQFTGTGVTDAGLARLKGLPVLTELLIDDGTKVTAAGLKSIKDFPALTVLKFNHNGDAVTDASILGLGGCGRLKHLELFGGKVTEAGVKALAAAIPHCRIVWDGDTVEPKPEPPAAPPAVDGFLEVHGVSRTALADWVAKLPKGVTPTWVATRTGGKDVLFDAVAVPAPDAPAAKFATWSDADPAAYDELKKTHRLVAEAPFLVDGAYHTVDVGVEDGKTFETWYGDLAFAQKKIGDGFQSERVRDGVKERWLPNSLTALRRSDGGITYSLISTWLPDRTLEGHLSNTPKELAAKIAECRTRGWRPHIVNTIHGSPETTFLAVLLENKANEAWDFTPDLSVADYEKELAARKAKGQRPRCVCSHEADGKVGYTVVWDGGSAPAAVGEPPMADSLRTAVEKLLAAKVTVHVSPKGSTSGYRNIESARECKPTDRIEEVWVPAGPPGRRAVADPAVLDALRGIPPDGLHPRARLNLRGAVTLQDLAALGDMPALRTVHGLELVDQGKIDGLLAGLTAFPALTSLACAYAPALSDKGLAALPKAAPHLTHLSLQGTKITAAGLASLRELKLTSLSLQNSDFDDAAVENLSRLDTLTRLDVKRTKMTEAGAKKLAAALPKCKIESDARPLKATDK